MAQAFRRRVQRGRSSSLWQWQQEAVQVYKHRAWAMLRWATKRKDPSVATRAVLRTATSDTV
eukprot:3640169-Lingulodinium_polyedra.AAC.1